MMQMLPFSPFVFAPPLNYMLWRFHKLSLGTRGNEWYKDMKGERQFLLFPTAVSAVPLNEFHYSR